MSGKISLLTTVSVSMLAFCLGGATANDRQRPVTHLRGAIHRVISGLPGTTTLYDQNDDDSGKAIVSSNFTDFDSFDSYGADDFIVPKGHTWKIRQVEVSGIYYSPSGGAGPADSENVLFYRDDRGLPGNLLAECSNIEGTDSEGSFAIKLPKSCKILLRGGKRYWLSVVANIDFSCCGEWTWETRNAQGGKPAAWENPNGGFGSCRTWDIMTSCIGNYGEGPDFMFTLKGKELPQ